MTARERVIRILKQGLTDLARLKSADRLLQLEYIPIDDPLYAHRNVQGFLQQYKTLRVWRIAVAQSCERLDPGCRFGLARRLHGSSLSPTEKEPCIAPIRIVECPLLT